MSNLKRFLALTIAVVMIVSGMALNVSAAKPSDVTDPDLVYAIDTLNKLGVIKGTNDKGGDFIFSPDDNVTREQFALFTARIYTALPELFDATMGLAVDKPFGDLKDPTYYSAIDHLSMEGIVLGVGDDKFDPSANVTLQDAVTMLMRSLGYNSLIYPTGFMVKASDANVRLIGENAPFQMKDVAPGQALTRSNMAKLLWNYLMTSKYELGMATVNGMIVPADKYTSVLSSFGFNPIVGYITAVEGWGADLSLPNGTSAPASAPMYPAKTSGAAANQSDITISPIYDTTVGGIPTTAFEANVIKTTKAALGLTETNEYLLGLKIQIFQDKRVNPASKIDIPAQLIGKKTTIKNEVNDAKYNNVDNNDANLINSVDTLTLGTDGDAKTYYTNNVNVSDILNHNLYMFDVNNSVMRPNSRNQANLSGEGSQLFALARFAKAANNANYVLEYVNNGTVRDDAGYWVDDFYYVFKPMQVGFYVRTAPEGNNWMSNSYGSSAGGLWVQFAFNVNDNPEEWNGDNGRLNDTFPKRAEILAANPQMKEEDFAPGNAYLYTAYGKQVHIYEKLAKSDEATSSFITGNDVRFTDSAKFPTVTFNSVTKAKAIGAVGGAGSTFNAGNKYNLFSDAKGSTIFARNLTSTWENFAASTYVMNTAVSTTGTPGQGTPNSNIVVDGTLYTGTIYNVFDPVANTTKPILIKDTGLPTTTAPGTPWRLTDVKGGNVYEHAYSPDQALFANNTPKSEATIYEYYISGTGTFNTSNSIVGGTAAAATPNMNSAIVKSTTKIVVWDTSATPTAYLSSATGLQTALAANQSAFAAVALAPYLGTASYVFVTSSNAGINAAVAGVYGSVLSNYNKGSFKIGDDTYSIGDVRIYGKDGVPYTQEVCVKNNSTLFSDNGRDTIVKVGGTVSDTGVSEVTLIANTTTGATGGDFNFGALDASDLASIYTGASTTLDDGNVTRYIGRVTFTSANSIVLANVGVTFGNKFVRTSTAKFDGTDYSTYVSNGGDKDEGWGGSRSSELGVNNYTANAQNATPLAIVYTNTADNTVIAVHLIKVSAP